MAQHGSTHVNRRNLIVGGSASVVAAAIGIRPTQAATLLPDRAILQGAYDELVALAKTTPHDELLDTLNTTTIHQGQQLIPEKVVSVTDLLKDGHAITLTFDEVVRR